MARTAGRTATFFEMIVITSVVTVGMLDELGGTIVRSTTRLFLYKG